MYALESLSDMSTVGQLGRVIQAKRLQMRKSLELLLSLDRRRERECEFHELGQLDALEINSFASFQ